MFKVYDLLFKLKFDSNKLVTELCNFEKDKKVFDSIEAIADFHVANSWINWWEFARDHTDEVNDVITRVGWTALGKNIVNAAKMAHYFNCKDEISNHVEDGLKLYAISYYKDMYGKDVEWMPCDLWNSIELAAAGIPETFSEITDLIDNYNMAITWE